MADSRWTVSVRKPPRYAALMFVVTLIRALGVATTIIGVIASFWLGAMGFKLATWIGPAPMWIVLIIGIFLSVLAGVFIWALADVLECLVDIAKNTADLVDAQEHPTN